MEQRLYDMVIIGGGPGGYTAALYAARAGLKTIVLEKLSAGGQMALTQQIDNYPGFPEGVDGFELGEKISSLKQQQEARKQLVCADRGEYDTGIGSRGKVSWKTQQRQTFDHKRFAADHPDVDLSRYYKASTSRQFKIKEL